MIVPLHDVDGTFLFDGEIPDRAAGRPLPMILYCVAGAGNGPEAMYFLWSKGDKYYRINREDVAKVLPRSPADAKRDTARSSGSVPRKRGRPRRNPPPETAAVGGEDFSLE